MGARRAAGTRKPQEAPSECESEERARLTSGSATDCARGPRPVGTVVGQRSERALSTAWALTRGRAYPSPAQNPVRDSKRVLGQLGAGQTLKSIYERIEEEFRVWLAPTRPKPF